MKDAKDDGSVDPIQWVDNHGDYLYRYALSRLRDPEAAEEVVQEAFVAGLRAVDQYAGTGSERAWLLGILKRKIIDYVRKRSRELTGSEGDASGDVGERLFDKRGHWRADPRIFGSRPEAALESKEFWEVVQRCLDALPEKQRLVFSLRELEQVPSDEVRDELKISSSNLWVLLHRARLGLAMCLKNKGEWAGIQP